MKWNPNRQVKTTKGKNRLPVEYARYITYIDITLNIEAGRNSGVLIMCMFSGLFFFFSRKGDPIRVCFMYKRKKKQPSKLVSSFSNL